MCLAIPGRVRSIENRDDGSRWAHVDYSGDVRTANLLYLPEARVGAYVLVQAGFAIRLLTEEQARESLEALAQGPVGPATLPVNP